MREINLFDLFKHWETDLRPYTIEALQKMTPAQLHYKPDGWHSSAWDLAVHMCGCEWIWIYRNVLQKAPWGTKWDANQFAGVDELLAFWEELHATTVAWLKETPITDLERTYPMPYADYPQATALWLAYHVMEHEIHHRAQIFMLMRMQSIDPPYI